VPDLAAFGNDQVEPVVLISADVHRLQKLSRALA
jgi:hypothetical protein